MNATIPNAVHSVLTEARRWLDVREDPPASNRGPMIDFALYHVLPDAWEPFPQGVLGAPWCAAYVALVGHLALGHAWPVKATVSCQALADWARAEQIQSRQPAVGDVFLLWYPHLGRYGHTGFVTRVDPEGVGTIEGNTSSARSREGHGVYEHHRPREAKTLFIRWTEVL